MDPTAIRKAAVAMREHVRRQHSHLTREPDYGVVRSVSPLMVELASSAVVLDAEQMILTQEVVQYDRWTGLAVGDAVKVTLMANGDWLVDAVISPTTPLAPVTPLPDYLARDSLAAVGLVAAVCSPNVPGFSSFTPGGGELVRAMLLEQRPKGTLTGAAIGLEAVGASPHGTAHLGIATFADTPSAETATYVAVTDDITADLEVGPLGIRRFPFTDLYEADGTEPLWLVVAFTNGWGTDPQFSCANPDGVLTLADAGHFRPRYLSLAAGAGAIAVDGTHTAWNASASLIVWGGVY